MWCVGFGGVMCGDGGVVCGVDAVVCVVDSVVCGDGAVVCWVDGWEWRLDCFSITSISPSGQ